MSRSTKQWGQDFNERPARTGLKAVIIIVFSVMLLGGIISGVAYTSSWLAQGAGVARDELGARALLAKYEWFKDTAASLDKKKADIALYENRLKNYEEQYGDTPRISWDRTDKSAWMQISAELLGVQSSYNRLAAQYNAQMAKTNWAFANVGQVPQGGEALPREFHPYVK